jgi:lipoprotein-anchoring transpeptidase ErfK/SrfK
MNIKSNNFSRRDFLKVGGVALGALAFSPYFPPQQAEDYEPGLIGRVTYESISVIDAPHFEAKTVGYHFRDDLLNLYYQLTPVTGPVYNPHWYRVWGGYVHSAFVQPSRLRFNTPLEGLPEGGQLCELTVPYSQPFSYSSLNGWIPQEDFRLYYHSTHWVTDVLEGPDRHPWYQITDELWEGYQYYIPAVHMRPIEDHEVTPLSTDVPPGDKRVEISLEWQTLEAYEGDEVVLHTQISSGVTSTTTTNGIPTQTPKGRFNIHLKMPSKHMGLSRLTDTLGDRALPGVPWTAFFTPEGHAIHGAYWHNNFGWPMSRGCVNMRNHEAKWLFRWMTPVTEPTDWERSGFGTQVIIS